MVLAEIRHTHRDEQAAEQLFQEAAQLVDDSSAGAERARSFVLLAEAAVKQNRRKLARNYFDKAFSDLLRLASAKQLDAGLFRVSASALQDYAMLEPSGAVRTAQELSAALESAGDGDKAQQALLALAHVGDKSTQAETLLAVASLCARNNRWIESQKYADAAVRDARELKRVEYLNIAAATARSAGKETLAAHYMEMQLSMTSPGIEQGLELKRGIADCYLRAKDYQKAAVSYDDYVSALRTQTKPDVPRLTEAYRAVGQSRFLAGNYAAAERAFSQEALWLSKGSPTSPVDRANAYWMLGNALSGQQKYLEAESAFRRARKIIASTSKSTAHADLEKQIVESALHAKILDLNSEIGSAVQPKDYRTAEVAARKCIHLLSNGESHTPELAQCTWVLSDILRLQGRKSKVGSGFIPQSSIFAGAKRAV